ncbi:MAG: RNA-binding protein [Rickettsiales bacterium]
MPKKERTGAVGSELSAVGLPERSCIVTRRVMAKEALLRFVVGPGDVLVADLSGKLPGRGMYVTASKLLVGEAIAKRAFNRAAGQQVHVPENFLKQIEAQLERRMADSLSLARKAGQVITGFEKVEAALKNGEIAALIHAADASDDGVRKLRESDVPTFQELPREVLSAVLGRENAVHAAVTHGPAAAFFVAEARRFAFFLQ